MIKNLVVATLDLEHRLPPASQRGSAGDPISYQEWEDSLIDLRMPPDKEFNSPVIDQRDVVLFARLCQFIWIQGEPLPLVYEIENEVYTDQGINLPVLKYLEAIGLVTLAPGGYVKKRFGRHTRLVYHGRPTKIKFPQEANNQLELGHVLLSESGKSLAAVCNNALQNQGFYEYVIEKWFNQGMTVSSILATR